MDVLKELLQILERRRAAWNASGLASDHYRKVLQDDERQSMVSRAAKQSDDADDAANRVERELSDFIGARADDIMEALRASEGKSRD